MAESGIPFSPRCRWVTLAFVVISAFAHDVVAQLSAADCREPQACREMALEARARGAYETFHDLAWRAVQTGRPNDPELMYLLARAQALSGRRRDALVMLRRLAEAGVPTDAATDEDFRRVRELPEWQGVAAITTTPRSAASEIAPVSGAASPAAPTTPVQTEPRATGPERRPTSRSATAVASPGAAAAAPPAAVVTPPSPTVRNALRVEPAVVEEAARFSTGKFTPAGLAYDAVSRRFLFGDLGGRRLFVVGDGSDRTVDLARAESAGFDDVTAIAIDAKRGDLWVATTSGSGSDGTIHRLQLISGRGLAKFSAPGDSQMRLADLAVTADGAVLVLDSATPRVLVLRPGGTMLEPLMPLSTPEPVSIAATDDGRVAFVAHRDGITRLDLQARRARPLSAPKGILLGGFEFVRLRRDVLVGNQVQPDGSRGLVRLQLNRDRGGVARAALIETSPGDEVVGPATISGEDLYYLVAATEGPDAASGLLNVRVRRIKLR